MKTTYEGILSPIKMILDQPESFTKNREAFERLLPQLRVSFTHGHYALVHDQKCVGAFEDYEEALSRGYELSFEGEFFVKQIESPDEDVHCIFTPFR
ncbi:MAG: hypothetical protein AAGA96_20635 [Verrucomicrobiota bacterium]